MPCEGKRHIQTTPVITSTAPFLGAGALGLGSLAVIKEKSRISLKCVEHGPVRENERSADEVPRPVAAPFDLACIQQQKVLARLGIRMVLICGMKVRNVGR